MYCHRRAVTDIAVLLDLPLPSCRQEIQPTPAPVKLLTVPYPYFFSFLPHTADRNPSGNIFPAIIQLPVTAPFQQHRFHTPQYPVPGTRLLRKHRLRRMSRPRRFPLRQIGPFPAPVLLHQPEIQRLPAEQIIFRHFPRLPKSFRIALQENFFSTLLKHRHFIPQLRKPKNKFPLIHPFRLMIPAIPKLNPNNILPLLQIRKQIKRHKQTTIPDTFLPHRISRITAKHRRIIRHSRNKLLIPHPFPIHIKQKIPQTADLNLRLPRNLFQKETPPEKRSLTQIIPLYPMLIFHLFFPSFSSTPAAPPGPCLLASGSVLRRAILLFAFRTRRLRSGSIP